MLYDIILIITYQTMGFLSVMLNMVGPHLGHVKL